MSHLKLYSKPNCPECIVLKYKLDHAFIQYEEIDITRDAMAHSFLIKKGHKSVPQLYRNDEWVDTKKLQLNK